MPERKPQFKVDGIFINRWSPRAMSGEPITDDELMSLFEAARWAPSSYNNQPWRFVYAKRNTIHWDALFNLMVPFNQQWTKNAAALMVVASKKTFDLNNKPSRTHSFDTGAAWENLALQASINGLVAHGMEGFDYEKAHKTLNFPDEYQIEAMIAVGRPGPLTSIPEDMQKNEYPSQRKKIEELIFEGKFIQK